MKNKVFTLILIVLAMVSCKQPAPETANAALDNIFARKSVRSYTSEAVSDADIETMLRAAMAAPSAMNRQPWEFVVLKDRNTLDSLSTKLKYAKMLADAPLAIVVCAETIMVNRDDQKVENMFWQQDASAATENLLLAAEALGLGAVWTACYPDMVRAQAVKDAVGMPETVFPLCVVVIGHPAGNDLPKDKWKPEKIHYDRW